MQEIFRLFRLDIATEGKYRDKFDEPLPDLSRHMAEGDLLPLLDCPNHDAPDFEVVVFVNSDGLEVAIGGTELDVALAAVGEVEVLDGELVVEEGDDDVTIPRLYGSVDDGDVTIADAGFHHRIAFHASVERGFGVRDEVAIEVE